MVDPFEAFNEVLRRTLICLRSEDHMDKFRNTVSIITQKISLHLRQECEEFGMNLKLYESLMAYNKANRVKFKNLLDLGRFSFEGRSEYNSILLVVTVGNGEDVLSSHIPKEWLHKMDEEVKEEMIGENNQEIVGSKRKAKVRGPGSKDFKSAKTAAVLSKPLLDKILKIISAEVGEYQVNNRNEIIEHLIQSIRKQQNINDRMKDDCAKFNSKIVYSLREFFVGLKDVGRQFKQVEATVDILLTAVSVMSLSDSEIASGLGVTRTKVAAARKKRERFNDIVNEKSTDDNEHQSDSASEKGISSDYSAVDNYRAFYNSSDELDGMNTEDSEGESETDATDHQANNSVNNRNKKVVPKNLFLSVLSPRERKTRKDKLDLNVVRDFCHDICRLDTFASAKIFVHNYDGTRSYHQVHIKSQSLIEYYKIFQNSNGYHSWQNENTRTTKSTDNQNRNIKKPTIKFRSFTNAFCPCCLDQKQRDCANHVQINLINALKSLGNLRRFHTVSVGIKNCQCEGHKNINYLQCPTSVSKFMEAVLCPKIQYASLSAESNISDSIEKQQKTNIQVLAHRDECKGNGIIKQKNRNLKREGAARQAKGIPLLNWGPLFSCQSKKCAYQKCEECGIKKFFNSTNMCDVERNVDIEVIVRKYENVQGRSRGMQLEIIEVKMNGDELLDHIIQCASLALPHEWNVKWNAHARTICVNKSSNEVLNLMTDFSAVLDHDVQDKLNTAIPCRSNQCIFLATHSPKIISLENKCLKRVQENDVWHFWSAQGGVLEANIYYHSVCTRHIINKLSHLDLKRTNIFTDGCAEQYKSRRNGRFLTSLAEDTGMTVTHNYAPTASFKTMVDGQGNVTKAFYRKLERSEEEGTRCQTTYQLFLLFAMKHSLSPEVTEDSKKNPMTITNRYHRYLVDIRDATPEMRQRAELEKDVIITDYIGERWDSPPIKGIKSLFSLIAKEKDGNVYLHSREHTCFCQHCMEEKFSECLHADVSGPLKLELSTRLPFKEPSIKRNVEGSEVERINFFKGALPLSGPTQILIAIRRERLDTNDEPFLLGVMTKKIKESIKEHEYEYTISGLKNKIKIAKGVNCVTYKLLHCRDLIENINYIPLKAKEIKIPLSDIYFPGEESNINRNNYLTCITHIVVDENNQNDITYIIDSSSIDKLRNAMTDAAEE